MKLSGIQKIRIQRCWWILYFKTMECKERIKVYWTKRSDSFLNQRRDELHDDIAQRWIREITEMLPDKSPLRILDVGCGTGYFTILLTKLGHRVTGIDLTPDMIANGKLLAQEEEAACELLVMDAEQLLFEDDTFDVVISRNLTWTLPHPQKAYAEWLRVLKKGGILLNFDADYGLEDSTDTSHLPKQHAHYLLGESMLEENNEIKKTLEISYHRRPYWDISVLAGLGAEKFTLDMGVSYRIYLEKDEFYNPTPLFKLSVVKNQNIREN